MAEFTVEQKQIISAYRETHRLGHSMSDEAVVSIMQKNNDGDLLKSDVNYAKQVSVFSSASASTNYGIELEKTSNLINVQTKTATEATQLTTEQAKDLSIEYLSENLQNAMEVYMAMDNGAVSEGYDQLKNFFDTELSSKNVGEVIRKEDDCIHYLTKAQEGTLTKREYYEQNKARLKTMLLDRMKKQDETGVDALDRFRGNLSREDFEKLVDSFIQNRIDTISTMQGIKDFQHELIMQTEEDEAAFVEKLAKGAAAPSESSDAVKIGQLKQDKTHPFDSDELMTFEETYELERGVEFSKQGMENLQQARGEMSFVTGAHNKVQSLKNYVDKIQEDYKKATTPLNDEYGVAIYTPQEPNPQERKDEITKFVQEYYEAFPQHAVKDLKEIALDQMLNLEISQDENGDLKIDFTEVQKDDRQKNAALNMLLRGLVSKQKGRLEMILGGKSLDTFIETYQNEYVTMMGKQNADELAKAMQEDQMTVIDRTTGLASIGGMALMVVGGVLTATPAAPLGAGLVSVGGKVALGGMAARNALGYTEALTRDKISKEEVTRRSKDFAMDVAGLMIGSYAGHKGLKLASEAVKNGAGKVSAFVIEHGTDFSISVLGDLAMIGLVDYDQGVAETLKQNGIGILVGTVTGISASKAMFKNDYKTKPSEVHMAGDVKVKPQEVSSNTVSANTLTSMNDAEIRSYYTKKVPNLTETELDYLVAQMNRVKNGENRWLGMQEEVNILRGIQDKYAQVKGPMKDIATRQEQIAKSEVKFEKADLTAEEDALLYGWYKDGMALLKNEKNAEEFAQLFDKAGTVLTQDTPLYRCVTLRADGGINLDNVKFLNTIKEGAVIDNAGRYTSTASHPNNALNYGATFEQNYVLKINVPAGTKVLDMRNCSQRKIDEFILPKGAQYVVKNIDYKTGIVECDLVLPKEAPSVKVKENTVATEVAEAPLKTNVKAIDEILVAPKVTDEEINTYLKKTLYASDEEINKLRNEIPKFNEYIKGISAMIECSESDPISGMNIEQFGAWIKDALGKDPASLKYVEYINIESVKKVQDLYECSPDEALSLVIELASQNANVKNFNKVFQKAVEIYNKIDMPFDDILLDFNSVRHPENLDVAKVVAYKKICDELHLDFVIDKSNSITNPEKVTPELLKKLNAQKSELTRFGFDIDPEIQKGGDFDALTSRLETINSKCKEYNYDVVLRKLFGSNSFGDKKIKLETAEQMINSKNPAKTREFIQKYLEANGRKSDCVANVLCYLASKDYVFDNPDLYKDLLPYSQYMFKGLIAEVSSPEQAQIVDRICSDKDIASNLLVMNKIKGLVKYADTKQSVDFANKILDDESITGNSELFKNICELAGEKSDFAAKSEVINRIFSDEKYYKNPVLMEYASEIVGFMRGYSAREVAMKILDNDELLNNRTVMENMPRLIGSIVSLDKVEYAEKVLNNKELCGNPIVMEYFGNIMSNAYTKEDYALLDRIFSDKNIYNRPELMKNMEYILRLNVNPERAELIDKILKDKDLYSNRVFLDGIERIYNYNIKGGDVLINIILQDKNYLKPNTINKLVNAVLVDRWDIGSVVKIMDKRESLGYSHEEFVDKLLEVSKFNSKINNPHIKLNDKIALLDELIALSKETKDTYKAFGLDVDPVISKLASQLNVGKDVIKAPRQEDFLRDIIANNNLANENMLKNFDFAQYEKRGLPVKYSREDFCNNINALIDGLSPENKAIIMEHFDIVQGEEVVGNGSYRNIDGFWNNKPLAEDAPEELKQVADKIIKEVEKFTIKNEVVTGNKEVDEVLTSLIQGCPEFAEIVGKVQHGTHKYSVDIHTLKVLQSAMNDPIYKTLDDTDKTILKMSILLHDTGKKGGVVDRGHQSLSAEYAFSMLKKYPFPQRVKDRILDIVDNHHWFEAYNKGNIMPEDVAIRCRRPEDFKLYEIFSKADFENVSNDFHLKMSGQKTQADFDVFMANKMKAIENALTKMYSNSNLVFDTQFVRNGELFPRKTVKIDGVDTDLKVLDFNTLSDEADLSLYGFAKGTTKENARFTVHVTEPKKANMQTVTVLTSNVLNESAWSTSLIGAENNRTYARKSFGFIMDNDQANIAAANFANMGSGYAKNIGTFTDMMFDVNYPSRTFVKNNLIKAFKERGITLTNAEYAELSKSLMNKKYLTQIREDVKIGDKTIPAKDLVECLEISRDQLFQGGDIHSEIVSINPRVKGLIAKVDDIKDCPEEFLSFAKEHDLPIVLMSAKNETVKPVKHVDDEVVKVKSEPKVETPKTTETQPKAQPQQQPKVDDGVEKFQAVLTKYTTKDGKPKFTYDQVKDLMPYFKKYPHSVQVTLNRFTADEIMANKDHLPEMLSLANKLDEKYAPRYSNEEILKLTKVYGKYKSQIDELSQITKANGGYYSNVPRFNASEILALAPIYNKNNSNLIKRFAQIQDYDDAGRATNRFSTVQIKKFVTELVYEVPAKDQNGKKITVKRNYANNLFDLMQIKEFKELSPEKLLRVAKEYGINLPERVKMGSIEKPYKPNLSIKAEFCYDIVGDKKVLKPYIEAELYDLAAVLRDDALKAENTIVPLMKKYNLTTKDYEFAHRTKSVQSLFDKLKNYILDDKHAKNNLLDAAKDVKDAVGVRTIAPNKDYTKNPQVQKLLKAGKREDAIKLAFQLQSQEIYENLLEVATNEHCPLKVSRLTNYMGLEGVPYLTDDQLAKVKYAKDYTQVKSKASTSDECEKNWIESSKSKEKPKTKVRESGYTAFQMNFTVGKFMFEWQFRGDKVNEFAEGEHVVYDIRSKKDVIGSDTQVKPLYDPLIKLVGEDNMSEVEYAEYNRYLTDYYRYLRETELGFDSPKPELKQYHCKYNSRLVADNLMALHDIASDLKSNKITQDEAISKYNKILNSVE